MQFLIADTFTDALARLPAPEQKAAKVSALDLQLDPSSPGLSFHRIERSRDRNFWSVRVDRDLRIIVHKTAASLLLAYVDRHDKAYAWAERRRIEAHPRTGAVQIVEVQERVEAAEPELFRAPAEPAPAAPVRLFAALSDDDLLEAGVPADWLAPVRDAVEETFFDLAPHLPAEAAEALLEYAATGRLGRPIFAPLEPLPPEAPAEPDAPAFDPVAFEHPDSRRRFRRIDTDDELRAALDAPWDRWSVFLHPSQRGVVERRYAGPARVAGTAGTGKTVVALHRAVRLARGDSGAHVLLTTFSEPLARALEGKVKVLEAAEPAASGRITVRAWKPLADDLHVIATGRRPRVAEDDQVRRALVEAATGAGVTDVSARFLFGEFSQVVDAWRIPDLAAYAETPRLGRRTRLGAKQRQRLWPVFADARRRLAGQGMTTWPEVFGLLADRHADRSDKPFTHVVVDEAQDLGVPELRFLRAIAPDGEDTLFFAGDLGQRIFTPPFSWKALGVDVRGRSTTLKVCYRTSRQIRAAADRLLPGVLADVDGREEVRRGAMSVFDGPAPEIIRAPDRQTEVARVASALLRTLADGVAPAEIGLFVRDRGALDRAREIVRATGLTPFEEGKAADPARGVRVGTMHLAKGLEFRAVFVLACDADLLPLQARVEAAVDEADLDEVYETERQLFYVACTRARDHLVVSGAAPVSEFLDDL